MKWNLTSHEVQRSLMDMPQQFGERPPREEALTYVVFNLLMEVEALRASVKKIADSSLPPAEARAAVSDPYRETAFLTHNCSGPSDGWLKLLWKFFPDSREADDRSWRDTIYMRELGFSEEEIETYKRTASGAEMWT